MASNSEATKAAVANKGRTILVKQKTVGSLAARDVAAVNKAETAPAMTMTVAAQMQNLHLPKPSIDLIMDSPSARVALNEFAQNACVSESVNFIAAIKKLQRELEAAQAKQINRPMDLIEQDKYFQEQFQMVYSMFIVENARQWISISGKMRATLEQQNNNNCSTSPRPTSFKFATFKEIYDEIILELDAPAGARDTFYKSHRKNKSKQNLRCPIDSPNISSSEDSCRMAEQYLNLQFSLETNRESARSSPLISSTAAHPLVFTTAMTVTPAATARVNEGNLLEYKNAVTSLVTQLKEYLIVIKNYENDKASCACFCFKSCKKNKSAIFNNIKNYTSVLDSVLINWSAEKIENLPGSILEVLYRHKELSGDEESQIIEPLKSAHKILAEYKKISALALQP